MNARLVLFDIDGTLINSASAGRLAIEEAFQAIFGIDRVAERAQGVRYAGMTDPVILDGIARAVGVDAELFAARRAELLDIYIRELTTEMQRSRPGRGVYPGVVDLLERLQARPEARAARGASGGAGCPRRWPCRTCAARRRRRCAGPPPEGGGGWRTGGQRPRRRA